MKTKPSNAERAVAKLAKKARNHDDTFTSVLAILDVCATRMDDIQARVEAFEDAHRALTERVADIERHRDLGVAGRAEITRLQGMLEQSDLDRDRLRGAFASSETQRCVTERERDELRTMVESTMASEAAARADAKRLTDDLEATREECGFARKERNMERAAVKQLAEERDQARADAAWRNSGRMVAEERAARAEKMLDKRGFWLNQVALAMGLPSNTDGQVIADAAKERISALVAIEIMVSATRDRAVDAVRGLLRSDEATTRAAEARIAEWLRGLSIGQVNAIEDACKAKWAPLAFAQAIEAQEHRR